MPIFQTFPWKVDEIWPLHQGPILVLCEGFGRARQSRNEVSNAQDPNRMLPKPLLSRYVMIRPFLVVAII